MGAAVGIVGVTEDWVVTGAEVVISLLLLIIFLLCFTVVVKPGIEFLLP